MADDEQLNEEQVDTTVPEMWTLAKPPVAALDDDDASEDQKKAAAAAAGGPKVGKLIKYLNDIEDQEEFEAKIQERDPATNHSLLLWATLTGKFVVVEWLIKKAKRSAFAFSNDKKELTVFDKWVEIRKEVEDREREKLLNPPEEEDGDDEEKTPDPTAEQLTFEALSEFHDEWADRAQAIVKSIGELGVYQGHRDEQGTKCGLGQTLFPDGDMYTGEYRDNKRHGVGTYYWAHHGMLYCGQWVNNRRHGVGRMVFADGSRYFGAWADDKIHGVGRYTYPDGSTYNGHWVKGIKQGDGVHTFPDGSKYSGSFVDGEFVSGEWILGESRVRYVGRFSNGAPTGKGVFVFKNRDGGSYRQEGEYVDGKWCPGTLSNKGALPSVELLIQRRSVVVGFTNECAALTAEDLVRAVNFNPFRSWLEQIESSDSFFVNSLSISSVRFGAGRNVDEVTVKVNAVDHRGNRVRGTDAVVLRRDSMRLLLLLTDGERTTAIVEQAASAAARATEQLRLPAIECTGNGTYGGDFLEVATPALRLSVSANTTMPLPISLYVDTAHGNAQHSVLAYLQHVHPDTITTAQSRLDDFANNARGGGFAKLRAVRLEDVPSMSTDALTIVAASHVQNLVTAGRLPSATAEPQRPPTPIPPAIEERPDIEPLLEAERLKNKPKAEENDE